VRQKESPARIHPMMMTLCPLHTTFLLCCGVLGSFASSSSKSSLHMRMPLFAASDHSQDYGRANLKRRLGNAPSSAPQVNKSLAQFLRALSGFLKRPTNQPVGESSPSTPNSSPNQTFTPGKEGRKGHTCRIESAFLLYCTYPLSWIALHPPTHTQHRNPHPSLKPCRTIV
jgi:hypothetical protein